MTPHTYIVVACPSSSRWFDLDAVRVVPKEPERSQPGKREGTGLGRPEVGADRYMERVYNPAGAPPLDWWQDNPNEPLPAYAEGNQSVTARLLVGDVRDRIREIPDGSIDLVCTSPPFLALRKYGDNNAEMGSEANPAAFIDALLELTAEFRRVLAPHGSIAIELGDTYSGSGGVGGDYNDDGLRAGQAKFDGSGLRARGGRTSRPADVANGIQHDRGRPGPEGRDRMPGWPLSKSLAGVPHAYMLSLAYGWNILRRNADDSPAGRWRIRNMIVWARPNPPVGALGDKVRPATSYITVGCVSSSRWFDLDAVRTPHVNDRPQETNGSKNAAREIGDGHGFTKRTVDPAGAPPLDWCEDNDPTGHATLILPTAPYPGAHYATWPPTLAKRLIKMMCPLRVCLVCGEPSRRIVASTDYECERTDTGRPLQTLGSGHRADRPAAASTTLGWTDCGCTCEACDEVMDPCTHKWRPGHVLDPFAGSGTTLAVAHGCGRDATGIELYEENADLIADRLGMFLTVEGGPDAAA